MNLNLIITSISFVLVLLISIIILLRQGKISTKYAILWIFSCLILLILVVFPNVLTFVTKLLGFEVASNMIFSVFIGVLIFLTLALTIIVSNQKAKITMLIQEISILKEKINRKK